MSHPKDDEELDPKTLRKMVVGLLAQSLRKAPISEVVRMFSAVMKERNIDQDSHVKLRVTHLLHDAADIRMVDTFEEKHGDPVSVQLEKLFRDHFAVRK